MWFRGTGLGKLAWVIVTLSVVGVRAEAQFPGPAEPVEAIGDAPQGDWAEVVTVTPTWLVLQNQDGQQFPVARASVRYFLIRWPTGPDRLAADAWVVAAGRNLNSNQLMTDHVDVVQRDARMLVPEPMRVAINERGEILVPLYTDTYETQFGDNFERPVGESQLPYFLYVVGPVVNRNPLVVGSPDNTQVTVLGPQGFPRMSLVTLGSDTFATFVRPGDQVWYDTTDADPRTLVLEQLMVYKAMPRDQFAP